MAVLNNQRVFVLLSVFPSCQKVWPECSSSYGHMGLSEIEYPKNWCFIIMFPKLNFWAPNFQTDPSFTRINQNVGRIFGCSTLTPWLLAQSIPPASPAMWSRSCARSGCSWPGCWRRLRWCCRRPGCPRCGRRCRTNHCLGQWRCFMVWKGGVGF